MNDSIKYYNTDPIFRPYHHHLMTHTFEYAFDENYMLVLSHDEVVYGKGTVVNKFVGNKMDKFGSLKTCYTMMMGHPGKKLLFMGQDFAQEREWNFKTGLDWFLCDDEGHRGVLECYRALLHIYTSYPVLYNDCGGPATCEWINSGDYNRNIFTFIRRNPWNYNNALIFVLQFLHPWNALKWVWAHPWTASISAYSQPIPTEIRLKFRQRKNFATEESISLYSISARTSPVYSKCLSTKARPKRLKKKSR